LEGEVAAVELKGIMFTLSISLSLSLSLSLSYSTYRDNKTLECGDTAVEL
jgi:hypothetical protein